MLENIPIESEFEEQQPAKRKVLPKEIPDKDNELENPGFENNTFWDLVNEKRTSIEAGVIKEGIKKLYSFFDVIKNSEGCLPTIIVYPETSSRPLTYAVQPLLEKVYSEENTQLPNRRFMIVHRNPETIIDSKERAIKDLKEQLAPLFEKRENLLRRYNKMNSGDKKDAGEKLSLNIHHLAQTIHEFKKQLDERKSELASIIRQDYQRTTSDRLQEIYKEQSTGPVLCIDDMLAVGETLENLRAFSSNIAPERSIYYFTFLAQKLPSLADSNSGSLAEHFMAGVSNPTAEVQEDWQHINRSEMISLERETTAFAWSDLFFEGFSYRMDRETQVGVRKNITSAMTHVSISDKKDLAAMRTVREKYSALGKEAVQALGIEDESRGIIKINKSST